MIKRDEISKFYLNKKLYMMAYSMAVKMTRNAYFILKLFNYIIYNSVFPKLVYNDTQICIIPNKSAKSIGIN